MRRRAVGIKTRNRGVEPKEGVNGFYGEVGADGQDVVRGDPAKQLSGYRSP